MKLFNTLSRTTEPFTPLKEGKVKMYACGLTVYSQPHIGNWVAYIYWDTLVRTLRSSGYQVTHIQNITDVGHLTSDEDAGEDKMLKGALKEGLTAWEVAEKYIKIADHEAYTLLELTRPDEMPRATEYINEQVDFVDELHKKGFTYTIADGIYYDTSKFRSYGEMAKIDIDGLQFGARVANTGKKNPTDFAVWKFSNPDEKRDMEWDNPSFNGNQDKMQNQEQTGKGFPGWHLECSVMARELLGDQIDIHTGGIDHIPVHHTNEIAQTEAITEKPFSKFWVHGNHLKVDGTKISKSLGNGYTLSDIIDHGYNLQAFKLFVLSKHYRTEGNFTWEILESSQNRLNNWQSISDLRWQTSTSIEHELEAQFDGTKNDSNSLISKIKATNDRILTTMQNDIDTPGTLALIDELFNAIENSQTSAPRLSSDEGKELDGLLTTISDLLGINLRSADITSEQKAMLKSRQEARDRRDWQTSDDIREELEYQKIAVRDTSDGQIWHRI